jgi:hypothetical protein
MKRKWAKTDGRDERIGAALRLGLSVRSVWRRFRVTMARLDAIINDMSP